MLSTRKLFSSLKLNVFQNESDVFMNDVVYFQVFVSTRHATDTVHVLLLPAADHKDVTVLFAYVM